MGTGSEGLRVGLLLPGSVLRLALHAGFLMMWFKMYLRGKLPWFYQITGCSAGAITACAVAPARLKDLRKFRNIVVNLKRSQIGRFSLKKKASLLGAVGALFIIMAGPIVANLPYWGRTLLHVVMILMFIFASRSLVNEALHTHAFMSPEPLRDLLENSFSEEGIKNSPSIIEVMTTDLSTGKDVVFSNRDPLNHDLRRMVTAVLASAARPPYLPPHIIDGQLLGEGEVRTSIPIYRLYDCDVIFIPYYAKFERYYDKFGSWLGYLEIMWDIGKNSTDRAIHAGHHRQEGRGVDLPELVFLHANEQLPDVSLKNFDQGRKLFHAYRIGIRTFFRNVPKIQAALMRARERAARRASQVV